MLRGPEMKLVLPGGAAKASRSCWNVTDVDTNSPAAAGDEHLLFRGEAEQADCAVRVAGRQQGRGSGRNDESIPRI
jgi:hypothetical protein